MPKRLKELADEATENQLTQLGVKIRESANQIWLAGLGAFSKAQQEGTKMFETLVEEGEKVQERTKVAVDERRGEMRGAWDKLSWDKGQAREGVRGPGGARAARLEHSYPQGCRRLVKAGPRADSDHQEDVGRGRDPRPRPRAQGKSRVSPPRR